MEQRVEKKKTRWWVVLLVIFGVLTFLGIVVIGGIVWWFNANKDRLAAAGQESQAEATAFAAGHDQNACVDEGLRKVGVCDGFICEAKAKVFTVACMERAEPTAGLCDRVPRPTEIIESSRWVVAECQRRGQKADNQRCHRFLRSVPEACNRTKR